MPYKVTILFEMSTVPSNLAVASVRTSGWSETHWADGALDASDPWLIDLMEKRALLLPRTASIVGVRISIYTLSENRMLPVGSQTAAKRIPGGSGELTDQPQTALLVAFSAVGATNVSRQFLRCIPDITIKGGEYFPSDVFRNAVIGWMNSMRNGNWQFLGRKLTNPSRRLTSLAGGLATFDSPLGAAIGQYVRFSRVIDSVTKLPIKGTFRITQIAVPATYTLEGLQGAAATNSGLGRLDQIALFPYAIGEVKRTVMRKIGRPFAGYRGRASRRRR
jgi:hypothetical protein